MIAMADASPDPSPDQNRDSIAAAAGGVVSRLGVHPVKSLRGLEPESWWFGPLGPWLDRRWMLIDDGETPGRFVSLREEPTLARCHVSLDPVTPEPGGPLPALRLRWDEAGLDLRPPPESEAAIRTAVLWGGERTVLDEGEEPAAWFSERLGRPVRLVRHLPERDPWRQPDPPADGAATGLSDGYPVLVVAGSTITAAVGSEWSPRRFRANIVIAGVPPHAEDRWQRIRIGEVVLDLVKPCVRCIATTVDPETGVRTGGEPLRTLAKTRTWEGRPVLGWNALVRTAGRITAGSPVEIETWRAEAAQVVQTG